MSENESNGIISSTPDEIGDKVRALADRLANVESKLSGPTVEAFQARLDLLSTALDKAQQQANQILSIAETAISTAQADASKACQASLETESSRSAAETAKVTAEASRDHILYARDVAIGVKASVETLKIEVEAQRDQIFEIRTAVDAEKNRISEMSVGIVEARKTADVEKDEVLRARAEAEASMKLACDASTNAAAASDLASSNKDKAMQAAFHAEAERDKTLQMSSEATKARTATEEELRKAEKASQLAEEAKSKVEENQHQTERIKKAVDEFLAEVAQFKSTAAHDAEQAKLSCASAEAEAKRAAKAHNLSTTAGLAGAFNEKTISANRRQIFWAAVLFIALAAVATIGWFRYRDLVELIAQKPDVFALVAELILSIFGIGAPVWLAWMATKMISKNFVVAEDYAYKASIAKAYVGFRDEAKGLDALLEQRLFAAAVTQLDANPVRFLDSNHPASPLQELLQQPFMQNVLEDQSVKRKLIEWLNARFNSKLITTETSVTPTKT